MNKKEKAIVDGFMEDREAEIKTLKDVNCILTAQKNEWKTEAEKREAENKRLRSAIQRAADSMRTGAFEGDGQALNIRLKVLLVDCDGMLKEMEYIGSGWQNMPVCPVCKTYKNYPNQDKGRRHTPDCRLKGVRDNIKKELGEGK